MDIVLPALNMRGKMLTKTRAILAFVLGMLILLAAIWLTYQLLIAVAGAIHTARPDSNLLAALSTGLIGLITILVKQSLDRQSKVRQELMQKKVPVYERYMEMWFDVLRLGTSARPNPDEAPNMATPEAVQEAVIETARQLILWGSDEVVQRHAALRRLGNPTPFDPELHAQLLVFEDVLKAIRKDLGHSGRILRPGDLLILFLNTSDTAAQNAPYEGDASLPAA